jgi:hypothetical protein
MISYAKTSFNRFQVNRGSFLRRLIISGPAVPESFFPRGSLGAVATISGGTFQVHQKRVVHGRSSPPISSVFHDTCIRTRNLNFFINN